MASGYGRGGRGAALLQALNAPTRKPGESPSSASETGSQASGAPPLGKPMGRGALMQKFQQSSGPSPSSTPIGRGQMVQAMQQSTQPPPVARGRSALLATAVSHDAAQPQPGRPMGRGALVMMQQASQKSPPGGPEVPKTPSPPTRTLPQPVVSKPATPQRPDHQSDPPSQASPAQAPRADGERLSSLEYMLQRMNVENVSKHGKKGMQIPLSANHIVVNCKNKGVYQYAVSFTPQIDSRGMRFRFINEHKPTIGEVKAFDGAILFLPIKLPEQETVLQSVRPTDEQQIQIKIKLTRVLPPESCVQLYNVVFRRIMSILKMCQVGRHYYDSHRPAPVPQHKLEVWPGYITAIQEQEGGLMLLTDVSHRVLRTETILDLIADAVKSNRMNFKKVVTEKILGKTVLTRYNNKTYSVDDILWDKTPMDSFENATGQKITYKEYYLLNYKLEIKDPGQPLLVHRPKEKDRERRGNRKQLDMICLVPELCFITGLTDEIRSDFRIMKDLACHTRISPAQRQQSLRKFTENVNSHPEARAELEKWGLQLSMDTIQLPGRKLPEEKILFRKGGALAGPRADWGNRLGRDQVIKAVDLNCWMVVYCNRNAQNARDFMQQMQKECPPMGWSINQPIVIELNSDRTDAYLSAIRDKLNENVQVVVAIFPTSRDDRYNAFKKLCCVESPVPSQVINDKTISKKPKLRSVVQKIALQINCKLGGELWAVEIPTKGLMVCGIDSYHAPGNKRNSIGALVSSINESCTRYYSRVCHQSPGQELIDGLKMCMLASLRKYHEVNHSMPTRIIVFRDGVGDGQLKVVGGHEVEQLSSCFSAIDKNYQPKLGVVVVQKRINTRLFSVKGRGQLDNPPPGTVMDNTITRKDLYDFFLVSQHVTQGTVTPTHYVNVHDETGWSPDNIQSITYKMTHLYYNWPGTVRVPAPCQYAHKLAYLVGQNLHKDPHVDLSDRLFYL